MRLTQILQKARWEKSIGVVGEMTEKYSNLPKSYIRRAMRQVSSTTKCTPTRCALIILTLQKKSLLYFRLNGKRREEIHDIYQKP